MTTTRRLPALLPALLAMLLASAAASLACSLTTIPDLTSGAGGTDGGGGAEAGAGEGGEGGAATSFCASLGRQATLCDDFDGDPDLTKRWSIVRPFDGTFGVALDTSVVFSKPRSLLSRVEPAAPGCAYATLAKNVAGAFSGSTLSFRVRFASAADLPGKSTFAAQSFGTGSALCQVFITASKTTLSVGEQIIHEDGGREESDYDVMPALVLGAWTRVVVDYDVPKKKITVTLNDLAPRVFDTTLVCPYAPGGASAQVGLFCEPTSPSARRASFDDVVLDLR